MEDSITGVYFFGLLSCEEHLIPCIDLPLPDIDLLSQNKLHPRGCKKPKPFSAFQTGRSQAQNTGNITGKTSSHWCFNRTMAVEGSSRSMVVGLPGE